MRKIILSTAALAISASMAMAQDVVRLGTEGAYPRGTSSMIPARWTGSSANWATSSASAPNSTANGSPMTGISIIPNLVSGNYDVIIAGMSITDERDEVIDFTQNYTPPDPSAYLAMSEDVDLEGGVIAAQAGTIQAGYVAESGATLVEFATPEETIAAVRNGEADAVLADKSFLTPVADEDADLMIVGPDVALGGGVGLGVRESDPELKATLDAAIQSMKDDGSLNAMIEKWDVASTF